MTACGVLIRRDGPCVGLIIPFALSLLGSNTFATVVDDVFITLLRPQEERA
jgi:hypothetical protein